MFPCKSLQELRLGSVQVVFCEYLSFLIIDSFLSTLYCTGSLCFVRELIFDALYFLFWFNLFALGVLARYPRTWSFKALFVAKPVGWPIYGTTTLSAFRFRSCSLVICALQGASILAPHTLLGFVGWPVRWPATSSYLMVVSWHACCSLRPYPTRDRWLARSLVSHGLLPSGGLSADPFLDHCALILLGLVGWPVRWSALPSYFLRGLLPGPFIGQPRPPTLWGSVSWHACCSLCPHPTRDRWRAHSLVSHALLPSGGSSADLSVDHCAPSY